MAGTRLAGKMRNRVSVERILDFRLRRCLLLMLLYCVVLAATGPAPRLIKLGVQDVHDEQSVEDRRKVMAILQQLQAANMRQVAHEDSEQKLEGQTTGSPSDDEVTTTRASSQHAIDNNILPRSGDKGVTNSVLQSSTTRLADTSAPQSKDLKDKASSHTESVVDSGTTLRTVHGDSSNSVESHNESQGDKSHNDSYSDKSDSEYSHSNDTQNGYTHTDRSTPPKTPTTQTDVTQEPTSIPSSLPSVTNTNVLESSHSPQSPGPENTGGSRSSHTPQSPGPENTGGSRSSHTPQSPGPENTGGSRSSQTSQSPRAGNSGVERSSKSTQSPQQTDSSSENHQHPSAADSSGSENHQQSSTPGSRSSEDHQEHSDTPVSGISEDLSNGVSKSERSGSGSGSGSTQSEVEEEVQVGLLFEGDIMLSAADAEEMLHGGGHSRRKRKVTYSKKKLWTLPIPYIFDQNPKYKLNCSEMERVKEAIAHLEQLTCITFRQVNATDPVRPILSFKKDSGCWSYVGKEHAFHFQEVSTGEGCFEFGTLLHELGHAIGFWHEHSRPDRKGFIRVHTDRVRLGEEFNFKVESWGELDNMNVPYDVGSIMHYGSTYFSRSGREITVESLDPRLQRVLGQRLEMTFYDVKLANLAYCSDKCVNSSLKCLHEGYPDPKRCGRCRCPPGLTGQTCNKVAYSDQLTCGGQLYVGKDQKYSISSPSHPWLYPANIACTWLIRTEPGRQIVLTVDSNNFMTHPDCGPYPTTVCTDYLEVKYNVSFGYTGARYCCGLPPQEPLQSSGNSMLVLFVTRSSGQGGFLANITAEPCGGCHPGAHPQPACRKSEKRECVKVWNSTQYVTCPVYFHKSSPDCNTWITKQKSRLAVCTSEVEYCCDGFRVKNGLCYRTGSKNITVSIKPLTPTPQTNGDTGNTDIGQDADGSWSAWSPWQPCSRTCGGCGLQTRQRTCDIPTKCGGQARELESRACNTFPCPEVTVYMCTTTRIKDYFCGWGKCYRRVKETGPCYSTCCPGYVQMYGKCVPKSPT